MIVNDKLLNSQQTSDFLGITKDTLAVWRTTKRYPIPYIKVGHLIKYKLSDLERWLDSRTKNIEVENNYVK